MPAHNHTSRLFSVAWGCAIISSVIPFSLSASRAADPARVAAVLRGEPTAATSASPKSLEEAIAHLERTLGKYDPDNQIEWQIKTAFEYRSKPDPKDPEVLQVFNGLKLVGHPFREAEAISFDEIWHWERKVYDVGPNDARVLTRTQVSHNVTRISISKTGELWSIQAKMLSNGLHNAMGKSAFFGIVKWHEDGFELIGTTSVDYYYGAGSKLIPGISYGSTRYIRQNDELVTKVNLQPYELAIGMDGEPSTFPDFKKPLGSKYSQEFRSVRNVAPN